MSPAEMMSYGVMTRKWISTLFIYKITTTSCCITVLLTTVRMTLAQRITDAFSTDNNNTHAELPVVAPNDNQVEPDEDRNRPNTTAATTATAAYRILPLIQRSLFARLDVGPFIFAYLGCLLLDSIDSDVVAHGGAGIDTSSVPVSVSSFPRLLLLLKSSPVPLLQLPIVSPSVFSISIITILYAFILFVHISLVLTSQWYVSVQVDVGYHYADDTDGDDHGEKKCGKFRSATKWTHCFVQPIDAATTGSTTGISKSSNGGGIAPIVFERSDVNECTGQSVDSSTTDGLGKTPPLTTNIMKVTFHDRVFRACYIDDVGSTIGGTDRPIDDRTLWLKQQPLQQSAAKKSHSLPPYTYEFRPIEYPIHLPIVFYTKLWDGHSTLQSCRIAQLIYGMNTTIISLPSILQLLQQQLLQPLFIFQLLCITLWCCDEYWYYAIYTLVALIVLEYTLSYTKLKGLQRLHTIGSKNQYQKVYVKRGCIPTNRGSDITITNSNVWMKILVAEIVPGDIISLSVYNDPIPVPADIILLYGTAVCDEALLTGESIPQIKQPLQYSDKDALEHLDINDTVYKESMLFGGTTLLVSASIEDDNATTTTASTSLLSPLPPPDHGIVGMVVRTGFETTQGNLLRTMVHSSSSSSNESHNTMDTFVFILLLLLFAVGAAMYVLSVGWYDDRRNHYRLVLHVIMIITSVVPPELPMELSLAITNSVGDLIKRCNVYCTEHYRIPYAGQINICCFDKTGTLTSDEMQLKGVRLFDISDMNGYDTPDPTNQIDEDSALKRPIGGDIVPRSTLRVMAACHSLATACINQVIGDPLEIAVMRETGYHLMGNAVVAPIPEIDYSTMHEPTDNKKPITILHRFSFSSKLKRMTVLCTEGDNNSGGCVWAITKGAPEIIKNLLSITSLPSSYDAVAFYHMSRGRRVLAMAYRDVGSIRNLQLLKDSGRDKVECELLFAGFLVLDCPLKPDSKSIVSDLFKSGLGVVMITGDAILTATEVARQVGIIRKSSLGKRVVYEIRKKEVNDSQSAPISIDDPLTFFECVPLGRNASTGVNNLLKLNLGRSNIDRLVRMSNDHEAAFCITGDVLVNLASTAMPLEQGYNCKHVLLDEKHLLLSTSAQSVLQLLVPIVSVFARHTPHQKEAVVAAFNAGGYRTLMCGDGTNDVGALKRAHVGISIISAPNIEKKQRDANTNITNFIAGSRITLSKKSGTMKKKTVSGQSLTIEESLRQLRQAQDELDQVELGDASVAAPFTSRAVSIKCCKDVIQQGRCTLVTMLQIYKILGINCLVNAFVLSELFLHGVKQGDRQLTILGMVVASLFYFVTRAEPLPKLSSIQPPASVLCIEALLSIAGQCLIHVIAIFIVTECALSYVDPFDPSLIPDGPFNPNVLNTCTFLLTCMSTINTFSVNYYGRPYMKDVHENKLFYRTIQILYFLLLICSMEIFIPLNDLLQLTTLPNTTEGKNLFLPINVGMGRKDSTSVVIGSSLPFDSIIQQLTFPGFITITMILDTMLSFSFERTIRRIYAKKDNNRKIS